MFIAILIALSVFFNSACAQEQLADRAVVILDTVNYSVQHPSIITENEWKELQLDRLLPILDRTQTSFGRWGLCKLLNPIADVHEITERQKIVSFLVENEDVLLDLQRQLSIVHRHEKSLLSYWEKDDQLNASCNQFYYTIPVIKKYFNKSSAALNASFATSMVNSLQGLLFQLCLHGVYQELNEWLMTDKKDFNLVRGMRRGLEGPLRQHSFELDILKGRNDSNGYVFKDYCGAFLGGSFGDRYQVLSKGYRLDPKEFGISYFGDEYIPAFAMTGIVGKGFSFLGASLQTVVYDFAWGMALYGVAQSIIKTNQSLNQLQHRVSDIALCCRALKNVHASAKEQSFFADRCGLSNALSEQLPQFLEQLSAEHFAHKRTYLYSRGHVLSMHGKIKKIKKQLVPLLQSIALIDAYCSIAQLYKEKKGHSNSFSFAQFVDARKPYIAYKDAWLALLPHEQAVANDLCLGKNYSGKVVITGPNGGGKSTVLKACGVSAVLAQSWGIVPAASAQQTVFNEIKTVFVSSENLEQGLSTFMSAKKRMQEMYPVVQKSNQDYHVLALIDEPYIGTVDEESAKRIYNFGRTVAQYPCTLMYIATHVKKPVQLASDTQGVFANYHVGISEQTTGNFELSFLLQQGPASWWFEDEEKRGRFVDWISVFSSQKALKKDIFSIDGLLSLL